MPRRGRCRCGTILLFERTAQGYKVRCTVCGAVVRLRSDTATHSRRVTPPLPPMMASTVEAVSDGQESPWEVGTLDMLDPHRSSSQLAVVEMEVYRAPKPRSSRGIWIVLVLAFIVLALVAGTIVLVLTNSFREV